ncbi:MAG: low-specificity L-threonine aldolase [Gammaproteobacteria bacterium]|nr:low-specificity L-threonine aldolase [Gammaproteobacteria bacterium]
MKIIDLRSDTVTQPTEQMKKAMIEAPLGDDVYGEDPTVNILETKVATLLSKEAAMFTPSCTQSNLIALMSHCQRGDEYIAGQSAHSYLYEAGGGAVLGSIQPQPIIFEDDGSLDLDKVAAVIKPQDVHFANSRLLCLENTMSGKVLSLEYLQQVKAFADKHKLSLHLDGARIFNAAVKLEIDVKEISKNFDTISICLSKGLGAPVGAMIIGNKELINKARAWRKMLGGGMRQAGMLAAAGIYALDHHVERLVDDHSNATFLAEGLANNPSVTVLENPQTNMLFIEANNHDQLVPFLKQKNIILSADPKCRIVTHIDISTDDIYTVINAFNEFYE